MSEAGLETTTVVQVGIVVRDVAAKARAWADVFGLPMPAIIITDTVDTAHTRYHGAATDARAKLAFFDLGQVSLELIEPIGAPSTWRDQLEQHGESLHHIAFFIKGMPNALAYLEGKGMTLLQTGDYTGGRYAYVDALPQLGLVLELLEND